MYVVVGLIASALSVMLHDRRWGPLVPAAMCVPAAQLAGLGFVAVKHWRVSFGVGGGYAGQSEDLVRLAWVIAVAGVIAWISAVAQLVTWRVFPVHAPGGDVLLLGGTGLLVVLALPFGIGEGVPEMRDLTSLGAFALIYSVPIGVSVASAAWLSERVRSTVIGSCAAAAALSAIRLIPDLSHSRGRPALVGTAVLLVALAAVTHRRVGSGAASYFA
jgi:hypothetical protein